MNSFQFQRRDFLKSVLVAGGGLSVFGGLGPLARLAQAQSRPDRYYVFCYFSGGWDILLGLDPRDPVVFNNGVVSQTRIQPGYDRLVGITNANVVTAANGLQFGPYIGEMLQHAPRLAVVRGMSMDTLTHEVGRRRFLTGKPPSGLQARGSTASAWLSGWLGEEHAIPNLSVQVESYNVDQPTYATALRVNSVPDLLRALRAGNPTLDARTVAQIDALLEAEAECAAAKSSPMWSKTESSRGKAKQMVTGGLDQLFDFLANTPQMEALRAHYGITGTGNAVLQTPEAQAALASRALTGGISRCVSVQVAGGLDTHFVDWETDQGPRQMRGFNVMARLASDLAAKEYKGTGTSWLDHTTIVGFSEFSRTSMLNDRRGRDHALTNAAILLGGNIKGGTVVGASSIGLSPQPINLTTGAVQPEVDGGQVVRPEHILQTLYMDAGMTGDPADLRVSPINALLR